MWQIGDLNKVILYFCIFSLIFGFGTFNESFAEEQEHDKEKEHEKDKEETEHETEYEESDTSTETEVESDKIVTTRIKD